MVTENPEIWNLNALCRCCHSDGYFKSLKESYVYENELEIYSKMLNDVFCFEISPPVLDASYTICDPCIQRLRDAFKFKKQVLLCEKKFEEYCKNELVSRNILTNDCIKTEYDAADKDHDDDGDTATMDFEIDIEVKCDDVKTEENEYEVSLFNDVKYEGATEAKVEFEIPNIDKRGETKGSDVRKKAVAKKTRGTRKLQTPYDRSLEVEVKTDSGVVYSCSSCGGNYPDHKLLKRHIMTSHSVAKYKCYHCVQRFSVAAERNEHMRTHSEFAMKCNYCDKVFYLKSALKEHQNTHTRERVFTCDLCSKEFAYKATLRTHLRGHYGTKKRCICHLCGHGFNDRANLNAHILTVHEKQRPFHCQLCPKTFTANKHLKAHLLRHAGDQNYFCDQCPKKFYCNSSLRNHKLSHLNIDYRYSCKVCRRRFVDRGAFMKHLRKAHIGQRPFKCHLCEKDFVCKYSMKRHVSEHSGLKPFHCEQCDAKFSQRGALKRHVDRKHGLPKEDIAEKCDLCNKSVTDLKKHMLCHNNKRFACEYCDKSYSENNVLTRHKKVVHFGIKPHVCEFCDKKYVKVQSLKNHQLKVHKVVSKVETDEDFDSAVAKFSIKNKKGKIKTEGGVVEDVSAFV